GYVRNNPINAIDPDGRVSLGGWVFALGLMITSAGTVCGAWAPAIMAGGLSIAAMGQAMMGHANAALVFGGLSAAVGYWNIYGPTVMSWIGVMTAADETPGVFGDLLANA